MKIFIWLKRLLNVSFTKIKKRNNYDTTSQDENEDFIPSSPPPLRFISFILISVWRSEIRFRQVKLYKSIYGRQKVELVSEVIFCSIKKRLI